MIIKAKLPEEYFENMVKLIMRKTGLQKNIILFVLNVPYF